MMKVVALAHRTEVEGGPPWCAKDPEIPQIYGMGETSGEAFADLARARELWLAFVGPPEPPNVTWTA